MPPLPKKFQKSKTREEKKSFHTEKKGRGVHISNLVLPKQNIWVCPKCKTVHRGFLSNVCRNPECSAKICVACTGSGVNSHGRVCMPCGGTGKQK